MKADINVKEFFMAVVRKMKEGNTDTVDVTLSLPDNSETTLKITVVDHKRKQRGDTWKRSSKQQSSTGI